MQRLGLLRRDRQHLAIGRLGQVEPAGLMLPYPVLQDLGCERFLFARFHGFN